MPSLKVGNIRTSVINIAGHRDRLDGFHNCFIVLIICLSFSDNAE